MRSNSGAWFANLRWWNLSGAATAAWLLVALLLARPARSQNAADGFAVGFVGFVESLAVQADGKILISGSFTASNSVASRTNFARLNADGSLDASFAPELNYFARRLLLEPDGSILAGGAFQTFNPWNTRAVRRFDVNGVIDNNFLPELDTMPFALARQADGKVLAGGQHLKAGGQPHPYLARFNTDGTVDASFTTDVDGVLRKATLQADGKILIGGVFSTVNGVARESIARLNPDGTLDMGFNPGANGEVHSLVVQADGKIVVAGDFTSLGGLVRERLGRVNPDGSPDGYFHPGADRMVRIVAVQSDGKVLAGGNFTKLGGQTRIGLGRLYPNGTLDTTASQGVTNSTPGVTNTTPEFAAVVGLATTSDGSLMVGGYFNGFAGQPRTNIARLLSGDCSVDTNFVGRTDGLLHSIAVQRDGKYVTAGLFNALNGQPHLHMGRFNSDGSVDASFNASLNINQFPFPYPFPSLDVNGMAIQPDGKILVAGIFNEANGTSHTNIVRFNSDGSVDGSFIGQAQSFNSGGLRSVAVQADGKILVGGIVVMLSGQPRKHLGRLNPDGSADLTFNPEANDEVLALAVQSDGKILVGGQFTMLGGQSRSRIARLNPDGSVDPAFNPGASNPTNMTRVYGFGVQTDGKIVVHGEFHTLAGATRHFIGRLNPDGSLDEAFNPGADGIVYGVSVQPDGKIAVGGFFNQLGGQPRKSFGRLSSGTAALQSLTLDPDDNSVTWSRSGSAPEIEQVTIERSLDGVNYTLVGDATRIDGGWRLTGLGLPAGQSVYVRARGRVTSGLYNGSSGISESIAQFYRIPAAQVRQFGPLGGGLFQFAFDAVAGRIYTVLATTNIEAPVAEWEVLGPAEPAGDGTYRFSDPGAANHPRRFYLLRSP